MKIAVIGARGFVGSSICQHLKLQHTVIPVTRDTVNLLDSVQVSNFVHEHSFDVIINCAASMNNVSGIDDARNNFGMFMNFYDNRKKFGKFINMASAAEYDRRFNIDQVNESEIFNRMPVDSYGWSQNMKSRISAQTSNFYNIRIFNCFGNNEIVTRIFPRFLRQGYIEITDDRYFDYFSVHDMVAVVKHCAEQDWSENDINLVYQDKYKISEVLRKFAIGNNIEPKILIVSESENNYTGNAEKLKKLSLPLQGLDFGLLNYTKNIVSA